ncbi:MAG TPA: FkbM family methyltransferase [Patescibacteria group bacterium]|nr:FkbM family methyltransferase [Patescibacteria group bacterium]
MIQPAKVTHFTQQGYKLKGLIHGGASDGEEIPSYQELGIENILCFEPLLSARRKFEESYPDVPCYGTALSDRHGRAQLLITKGDGQGSSLLEPIINHPEVQKNWTDNAVVVGTETVTLTRLDDFFRYNHPDFNTSDYDCLVLDTQGNEWEVLHGCGSLLRGFKYISVELSETPVYEGEHPGQEVIDWLVKQGFTQDTPLQSHNDVFFIRSDIKVESELTYYGLA